MSEFPSSTRLSTPADEQSVASAKEGLQQAEALAQYLKNSDVANDQNADVVIPALAESIIERLTPALELLE